MSINLSFSSVSMYSNCPRKYFLSYIAKLSNPSSTYMTSGSILHKCAEEFAEWDLQDRTIDKIMSRYYELMPEIDTDNLIHEVVDGGLIINPIFESKAIISLKTIYEDIVLNHYGHNRADLKPNILQQEQWFSLDLKDGHKVRGLIDRIDLEDENSKEFKALGLDPNLYSAEHIVDYKSGQSRATFKSLIDPTDIRSMQLLIYTLARYKETGKIPYKSSYFYIEPAKGRKKQEGQYRTAAIWTLQDLEYIENFLNDVGNEIKYNKEQQEKTGKEMFKMGDNPDCFFCDFNKICPILAEEQLTEINNNINTISNKKPQIEIDVSDWL